jgi:hypothetical protein
VIADMIDQGRVYVADRPDATAAQLLDHWASAVQSLEQDRPRGTCRRCSQPIVEDNERWYHDDPDRSRGCRAASFVAGDGWDEALGKTWMATPR